MSDIEPFGSDDESHLFNSFDNEAKFAEDLSYGKSQFPASDLPNQSVEYYSTTYVSTSKKMPEPSEIEPDSTNLDLFDNDSLGLSDSEKY